MNPVLFHKKINNPHGNKIVHDFFYSRIFEPANLSNKPGILKFLPNWGWIDGWASRNVYLYGQTPEQRVSIKNNILEHLPEFYESLGSFCSNEKKIDEHSPLCKSIDTGDDHCYVSGYQNHTNYFATHTHNFGLDYIGFYFFCDDQNGTEIWNGTNWITVREEQGLLLVVPSNTPHRFYMKAGAPKRIMMHINFSWHH